MSSLPNSAEIGGEAVFGRDDIALEPGFEGLLSEILFDISEPEINWPLTEARAREWIARLTI